MLGDVRGAHGTVVDSGQNDFGAGSFRDPFAERVVRIQDKSAV